MSRKSRGTTALLAGFVLFVFLFSVYGSSAGTSSSYPNVIFSDGFESGTTSAWSAPAGTGSTSVLAAAAHSGSYGLRMANSSGQYDILVKSLPSALVDSSVSFWVRVSSAAGVQEVAETRDGTSSQQMWGLLYDGSQHGFWFYPRNGAGQSSEIFTGNNSAPLGGWVKVEVQYTATSGGGVQLYVNGQTQSGWGLSGDYSRSSNLQRLQLWNDAGNTVDFDDVTVAAPAGAGPSAPGAPTSVSGTAGNGSVALAWTAPASDGGSAITGYRVTPYVGGTAQTPVLTGSTATSFTVNGLTNGTAYTFTVAAINAVGTSPDSAASGAVTPTAPVQASPPGAPTSLVGTAGDGSVALSWAAPTSDGGAAITSYRITPYIGSNAQSPIQTGSAATSRTITSLTNGTAYTFRVAATNSAGTGPDSAASAAITPAPRYPNVIFSDGFESGTTSAWSAPAGTGSTSVLAAAAHSGSYGLRMANGSGQYDILVKSLPSALVDSSVSFWVRVSAAAGVQEVAETRDGTSSQQMWGLLYDGSQHGFWFYPRNGAGQSSEIFTGNNSAPLGGWVKVEVQYTATSSGGVQLYLNGQTQSGWGLSGDYSRSSNLQRLQLWNDAGNTVDFDDVTVAAPAGAGPSAPGAPTSVSGTAGNGSVALAWTAPASDGGSAITGYRVTPTVGGTAQTPVLTGSTATSFTVNGLTNGTAYTFTVAAINAVGTGPDSAASGAVTPTAGVTVPGAPTAVSGAPGDETAALTWTAPSSNGGSPITGYRVTPYVGGTPQTPVLTGSAATSFTVTGLTNGTSYTFTVAAINAAGTGPDSAPSNPVTPIEVETPPGPPTAVSGTPGNGSVVLSWLAPTDTGGHPITGYRVTPYVGGTAQTPVLTGSTATSFTVNGLTNGTAYTFTVAAINAIGTGPESVASSPVTPVASRYSSVAFADGFETGSLSAWDGSPGTGSATAVAGAAHSGSYGLRLSNTSGQFGVVTKNLPSALTDSSVSFWVRFGSVGGVRMVAQARDQSSSSSMWGLLYDGSQHGFWFYPYRGSSSTEIFTGANTAPANTWVKVEVQYTATSTGGAQLYVNGQTKAAWSVSGDYTRSTNLQRLQLWNDAVDTSDFDDVTVAAPAGGSASTPGAPTSVNGTPGNGSVALTWTAPASDGGSAITGYRVTPYIGGTAQTPVLTGSTATSFTVNGLTNGTAYTFRVAAINAVGTGPDSAASAPVTPTGATATVPGPPTNVSGTPGNGSVALTWTAPSSNGSPITGYLVTPSIAGTAQAPVPTGSTSTSFTVTGLTNGTAYTFTVAAINAIGLGPNSTPSSAITPTAPTPPGAPTNVGGSTGDGSVALTWTAPTSSGSSPITGYRVTPYIGGTAQTPVPTGSTATNFTVTGLTNGTAYTFTVAAINAVGTGPESAASSPITPAALNPIQIENNKPGDPSWGDFNLPTSVAQLSGYGSRISLNHGQSIDFYVTTTASNVAINIYRMGWYGGAGARLMQSMGTFPGVNQPQAQPDPTYGMVTENWSKTTTLTVPASWTTGVYLARLLSSNGLGAFIFFTVRDDGGHEPILFQTSVNTYQAYNPYGGTSLYNNNTNKAIYSAPHAMKVSFDRPFETGDGAGQFLWWEYPFVRWAEKQGYNVAYTTDLDTHTLSDPLTNHKAFLAVGHDEYWSKEMRDHVEGAIAAGVNVGFFAGNESYWQVRFEPSAAGVANRVMVGYKDFANCICAPGPDPVWNVNNSVLTTLFRDPQVNRPEERMMGVMFGGEVNNAPFVVKNSSSWVYAGTGWTDGTSVPGIVGYEYDHYFGDANTPANITVLSNTPVVNTENNQPDTANSTIYTAPSGALVFAAGTIQWSYGLDNFGGTTFVNAGIQRVTSNILARFTN